jgi:alpha-beta hydrolase superfamily lysophospholipase
MATLRIHGVPDETPELPQLARALPAGMLTMKAAVRVQAARASAPPLALRGLEPDDVVELELQDGLRLWSRVSDLEHDFGLTMARGTAEDPDGDMGTLPSVLTLGGQSRGVGQWAIKALKVVGLNIDQDIATFISTHVEGTLAPGPGLYRCDESDVSALKPVTRIKGTQPVLVFLHGTASSTASSFSGLWDTTASAPIRRLSAYYGGRLLAFQHESLTKSPIENARELVTQLAKVLDRGAEIHLVSHSRGGLIGELLARGMRVGAAPFTKDDLDLFASADRARDLAALTALSQSLSASSFQVTRFVRVACPARGTTLADGRLDRYLSVLINLASLVPGLSQSVVYDGLTALLAGVLKQRTDPRVLPGLEAMMPGAPLIQMLNRPDVETAADLHVLGGDLAPGGVFGRLKTLVTDLYYRDDHDLVVNTPAMFGGIARTRPIRYWIDTGSDVTHFHYFLRADTTDRLVGALTAADTDFRTLEAPPAAVTSSDYQKRGVAARPVVVVLPGLMGSTLSLGGANVWMNIVRLAVGGLAALGADTRAIDATGLLRDGYGDLCAYLAQTHDVVPFPYDWRLSVDDAAVRLRAAIDEQLTRTAGQNQPIRIVAHSMGGLVVQAMLGSAAGRATWNRVRTHPGARIIMLGAPLGGSHAIGAMLIGRDALIKKLSLLDLTHNYRGLLQTIAQYDGVLDLLPHAGALDLYSSASWDRLFAQDVSTGRGLFSSSLETSKSAGFDWAKPTAARLARARTIRDLLRTTEIDTGRTVYLAGTAAETACDLVIDESAPEGRRVRVLATAHGDGRVPWNTGIPQGVQTYFTDVVHGDLASTASDFPAILDLLTTGTTSKLATTPPHRTRAVTDTFEMSDPMPAMLPDEQELVASALGGERKRAPRVDADSQQVIVRIVHDNLTNATSPVLVGHYDKDMIVAAEKYLDQILSGRLTELHRMELYPGPLKTAAVVLNEHDGGQQCAHPGAVITGLGTVGDLTPGGLTATLEQALVSYGAECVGTERRRRQRERLVSAPGRLPVAVTALLIGSGGAGVTLSDSMLSLLRATARANARLGQASPRSGESGAATLTAFISQVDIFELYEDRAIEAVYALRSLSRSVELRQFITSELLVPGAEGLRRATFDASQSWWQRIRVKVDDAGTFFFEAPTQAARVSSALNVSQRRLVERFVDQAIGTTNADPDLGCTLFELLIPNNFKTYAPDRRNLVLDLDPDAAALPWELLNDRYDKGGEPLAVASGMIRQLRVLNEREQVMRSTEPTALVVGNPVLNDPRFPSLPGAADEADAVSRRLTAAGYRVVTLMNADATPMAVLSALHEQPWRILHLAGHGVFEFQMQEGSPKVSGLVLDNGLFFTAAEADQMRYVPEVVFINCCHLGQTRGDVPFHRLAANLATQFIEMGVRAVVAAGWAVDDAAAKTFSTTLYDEMFAGRNFGDAVVAARQQVYHAHGGTNTWGAYQCYGDPGFSLAPATSTTSAPAWVASAEVVIWAMQFESRARAAEPRQCEALLAELEQGISTIPESWWADSELRAAVGTAFGALDQFERGIGHLERIADMETPRAPILALEQLVNLRARWAWVLADREAPDTKKAHALLTDAETLLLNLCHVGRTAERCALLGGLHKRRAMMTSGRRRTTALIGMAAAYKEGNERAVREGSDRGIYQFANHLAAEIVLAWTSTHARSARARATARALSEQLSRFSRLADDLQTSTSFFDLSAKGDSLLLTALASRKLTDGTRAGIREAYASAARRGVSPRHRESMVEQLMFFDRMSVLLNDREAKALRGQLKQLGEELGAMA